MNGQTFVKIAKWIFRITSFPVICGLGNGIGWLLFYLMKERTAIGLSNLKRVFPEKSEQERKRILKTFWRNFCKDMLEAIKYFAAPSAIMSQRAVSYTHLRAHETVLDLVCRLLLEKQKTLTHPQINITYHSKSLTP